ncbi:heavy metal-binding protein HIP-like [Crassostrea angulata]|uniref:heavy metal-binding protein HIP-like n=1 Tax=Magallana angulata TaxID=2784310 RepID=UPI0022B1758D|nr:heavy metal-binding protein HIP-like [Crassostrea angulata]
MACNFLVVIFFNYVFLGHLHGLLLTDPAHVEQRLNQMENQIQGLSQEVNTLKQENAALKTQVSSGNSTLVYFSAYLKNSVSPSSIIDVVYDGVRSNYHNSYNPATGRFTAPVKGFYVFAWETVTGPNKIFDTELLVNGERVMLNNCNNLAPGGAYVSCSGTAPTLLKPGDIVHVRTTSGTYLHGGGWSSFSGWLVHTL